jgi:hypothetical protein
VVVVDSSSSVGVASASVVVVVVDSSSVLLGSGSGSLDEELSDELSLEELLSDVLSVVVGESGVDVGSGGETTIVLEIMTVVTLVSLSESGSDCLLVVSVVSVDDELGDKLCCDVIVPLLNWRLTWRGK